jgi:hypothetical protein
MHKSRHLENLERVISAKMANKTLELNLYILKSVTPLTNVDIEPKFHLGKHIGHTFYRIWLLEGLVKPDTYPEILHEDIGTTTPNMILGRNR